jgi:hypothetical protein
MKLGCSFKEPVVEKIECLVNQVMARTEPSDSDSPKMLLYYVPFALTRLYWGDWKSDARVFASVQEFAYQLKEGLFGSDEFLSYLEQTLDFPGVDAVPEFVIECLKRETVFSREDITLLAQFFLNNLCSQAPGVVGTLEEGLRILPGWVLLGLFEKEILSFFENWLETNLSEILTTALQGAVQARLITNLTKFLLVKKFWRESCGEHLDL